MTEELILGVEEPRIFTPPLRELTPETSLGYNVIDFAENVLHEELVPWQKRVLIRALEIVGDLSSLDWHFRFRTVIIEVARQNGKTKLLQILTEWFLYVFGAPLVIGTAQNLDTAETVWDEVVCDIEDNSELAGEIERVCHSNGKKALELTEGRKYKVAPLSRKGGRGQSADLVILDELREMLTWAPWSAISKTTMARPNAIVFCLSNAGDAASVVLRHLRMLCHRALGDPDGICGQLDKLGDPSDDIGEEVELFDDSIGLFEYSSPPGCRKNDRQAWAMANPSLNHTVNGIKLITERALASACASDPEEEFRTECLCQWIESASTSPFPTDSWENGKDKDSHRAPDAQLFYGVDVSHNHNHIAVAICGMRADHNYHIEPVGYYSRQGHLIEFLRERVMKDGGQINVAIQGKGANVSFMGDTLEEIQGVNLVRVQGADLPAYHGRFYEGVAALETGSELDAPKIYHRPAPLLDVAANVAVTKPMGDGAWVFNRDKSPEDISALIACVMAYGLATAIPEKPKRISAYADGHDLIFL